MPENDKKRADASQPAIEEVKKELAQLKDERFSEIVADFRKRIEALESGIKAEQIETARNEGILRTSKWWILAVAGGIALYFGYNSFWALPKAVKEETSRQIPGAVSGELAIKVPIEVTAQLPAEVQGRVKDEVQKSVTSAVPKEVSVAIPKELAKVDLGKFTEAAKTAAEATEAKRKLAEADSKALANLLNKAIVEYTVIQVPIGTMLPYFADTLPDGGHWAWADGTTNWASDEWVPEHLRGKPVPDVRNGLLISGPRPGLTAGDVWRGGKLTTPELKVKGDGLLVKSFGDVWPLSSGWVFNAGFDAPDKNQGSFYADRNHRDLIGVLMLSKDASAVVKSEGRKTGLGPNIQGANPDWKVIVIERNKLGQSGGLSGESTIQPKDFNVDTSDKGPPALVCNWIIRIK